MYSCTLPCHRVDRNMRMHAFIYALPRPPTSSASCQALEKSDGRLTADLFMMLRAKVWKFRDNSCCVFDDVMCPMMQDGVWSLPPDLSGALLHAEHTVASAAW
mmetsp:Transcript_32008/g.85451  ORF Transcript_32008/g.85451 Transcript_32008/m.85451 type:complete len:103 (-) Transcript_32008:59-367(-)